MKTPEGIKQFNTGVAGREKAKAWFDLNSPSMIKGRGDKYEKWMPLKNESVIKHSER